MKHHHPARVIPLERPSTDPYKPKPVPTRGGNPCPDCGAEMTLGLQWYACDLCLAREKTPVITTSAHSPVTLEYSLSGATIVGTWHPAWSERHHRVSAWLAREFPRLIGTPFETRGIVAGYAGGMIAVYTHADRNTYGIEFPALADLVLNRKLPL